jgi:hypothetical protein
MNARMAAVLLLLLMSALPAAAQQGPPATDTVLTPEQRALERLRAMGAVAQPDTARIQQDTVRAQQVRLQTAAPDRIQRDSIMALLMGVRGYIATEYQGDTARFQTDINRLELRGSPQVAREGLQLRADSLIVYEEAISRACGYGQPVLFAPGMTNPLVSDTVCFDIERQVGYARGVQTTVAEGATWNMRGEVCAHADDFYCHRAIFTDCDLPWPHVHYHFGAREVKVVRDNVLVARDVTLNFADVPVFWLPFMVQSLSQGRRSGILMPRFGINDIARTSSRYSRRIEDVGMFWAMNDYMGAELAMDWFADNWMALRGSVDYNVPQRFLRGGLTYRYFWPDEGGRQFTLSTQNSWQMDERTSVNLQANYSTSTRFVQQRTFDPQELNRSIDSNMSLRRRFDAANVSAGASRRQQISDNTVNWVLPSVDLSFSPITLFEAMPGEDRWFSNATLQASSNMRVERRDVGEENTNPTAQSSRTVSTRSNAGLSMGRFSLNQTFDFSDAQRDERWLPGDTMPSRDAFAEQRGRWNSSINFQQRLIGTSTLTPSISLGGEFLRGDESGDVLVHAPTRVDFGAGLRTELFGFWGGVGPFDRFRHRLSPNVGYTFSPAVQADTLQERIFSARGAAERNTISLGLSQTFEARYRAERDDMRQPGAVGAPGRGLPGGDAGDAPGAAAALPGETTETEPPVPGEPRRIERARTIQLLSITTDALMYDFVRAREEGDGLATTQIGNSLRSDLLQGFELRVTHDLFRPRTGVADGLAVGTTGGRDFAPHLSNVNASFSVSGDSWLFRVLRLGRGGAPTEAGGASLQDGAPNVGGPAVDRTQSEYGMVGTGRRTAMGGTSGPVGSWNASLNYSLSRPRDPLPGGADDQQLRGRVQFQPTEQWSVNWNTSYRFGGLGFTDHVMTLTRRLHDWDANFDFVRAQNGNFSFQFRVHLRANPDIKVDYSQSDVPSLRQQQF